MARAVVARVVREVAKEVGAVRKAVVKVVREVAKEVVVARAVVARVVREVAKEVVARAVVARVVREVAKEVGAVRKAVVKVGVAKAIRRSSTVVPLGWKDWTKRHRVRSW